MSLRTKVDQFMSAHQGEPFEVEDPTNVDQCMDLVFGFLDYLGVPRAAVRHLFAYEVFTTPNAITHQYFDIIPVPITVIAGDVVVFGKTVGPAGHISVGIEGTPSSFKSFDQNWDTQHFHGPHGEPICRVVDHTYNGVLGVLRLKGVDVADKFTNPVNGDTRDAQGWYNAYAERDAQWHHDEEVVIPDLKRQLDAAKKAGGGTGKLTDNSFEVLFNALIEKAQQSGK